MKGGFAAWLFGAAVWVLASTEIISLRQLGSGLRLRARAGEAAYAKIAGAAVPSFN
jgi:hypothetical protein